MYTCQRLNYSSSFPRNSEIGTISDVTIANAPTTAIGHTDLKEVELEGGRDNKADMVYFHRKLPNVDRFLNKSLWYFHVC